MNGREDKKDNDLFFVCSLIEYIGRKTLNKRSYIVNTLGRDRIAKIYDLADIYHSDNIDRVSDDFIEESGIIQGSFDNVSSAEYSVPSHWDIGKVYKRLIKSASAENNNDVIDTFFDVYNSFVSEKIQDYNSSFYYDSPNAILNAFLIGKIE